MITKVRLVLIANQGIEFLKRFEAISVIQKPGEIQSVWEKNKTPVIEGEEKDYPEITGYIMKKVPEELIDDIDEFTHFCHENGFECGEFRTGEVYDTREERCFMCEIAAHRGFKSLVAYNRHVDKAVDCIIYESPNFYVLPELGALKQGYVMIIPKEHYLSVAQTPTSLSDEYHEVMEDVEKILQKTYHENGTVVFMEHGSGPSGKTSHKKSIVHAHTHVVIDFKLKEKYKRMVQLRPCQDITEAKDVHYFSYQEGSNGQLMISMDPEVYVQRQFPRQVMAEELGFAPNQYNWQKNEFKKVTDAMLFHICNTLQTWDDASLRIKRRTEGFVYGFSSREF